MLKPQELLWQFQNSRSSKKKKGFMMVYLEEEGEVNPYEIRKELTDTMDAKAHVFRNERDLL